MADWQEALGKFAVNVEREFDLLKYRFRERLGGRDPIMILPYRGYGDREEFYIKGRVLEDKGIESPMENDSIWENLLNMYRRFESDEIPFAKIRARFRDQVIDVKADIEGYFDLHIPVQQPLTKNKVWYEVDLELLEPQREGYPAVTAEAEVMVPPPGAQFGVISDIDDTVLQTNTTHWLKMARTVFLGNARTRLPFPGAAAFYRALLRGADGHTLNPLFYVSSSPWNIYDLLSDFFNFQHIPLGPVLFLRDWGLKEDEIIPVQHRKYKLNHIKNIMDLYEQLPFILLGDSGQQDPEIYAEVLEMYPGRVPAIYIRNAKRNPERPDQIRELAKKVAEQGSTLILADDTLPLAEHAAEQGWISPRDLDEIRAEVELDQSPPGPLEEALGGGEETTTEERPTIEISGDREAEREAIERGAVEQALESGPGDEEEPPTVVVEGDQDSEDSQGDSGKPDKR